MALASDETDFPRIRPLGSDKDYTGRQWYLGLTGAEISLDLRDVWSTYDGSGVSVGVWDDGVQYTHWDLASNYDASRHVSVRGAAQDPRPRDPEDRHGTAVAGIIAAADNGRGTTGVAHGASITGVDILSADSPPGFAFGALSRFDVTNHSWGPGDAYSADFTDPEAKAIVRGLDASVRDGRGGLGTVNVFASGNQREEDFDANFSNFTNVPETIVVGAVGADGAVAYYSTPGASLLVSAPSDDAFGDPSVWTTDLLGAVGYNPEFETLSSPDWGVTSAFGGTSAAAPMVAGVVALMLDANPDLGWRDVQEILALTARHVGGAIGGGRVGEELHRWGFNGAETWNGGGLHHSGDYGFGLVDGSAAVRVAETWSLRQTDANRTRVESNVIDDPLRLTDDARGATLRFTIDAPAKVETVQVALALDRGLLQDYRIVLTSPSGTQSLLASPYHAGFDQKDWIYGSKAFWGESAVGDWTVRLVDDDDADRAGRLAFGQIFVDGGRPAASDVHVFTDAYSDYAGGRFGHARTIRDADGGVDAINAAALRSAVVVDLAAGTGRIDGVRVRFDGAFERVHGGDGNDALTASDAGGRLTGGRGRDLLRGGEAADRLEGGLGRDSLFGGAGDDRLWGGGGNDRLRDGQGTDVLRGGAGADLFILSADAAVDRVLDFRDGVDRIAIAGAAWSDLAVSDLSGGRVQVSWGTETLVVAGVGPLDMGDLGRGDFLFV